MIDPLDHLDWAHGIARLVASSFRFAPGSQDELDLESAASLVVVDRARGFDPAACRLHADPVKAFRALSFSHVRGACRDEAYRIRSGGTYASAHGRTGLPQPLGTSVDDATSAASINLESQHLAVPSVLDELIRIEDRPLATDLTREQLEAVAPLLNVHEPLPSARYGQTPADQMRLDFRRYVVRVFVQSGMRKFQVARLLGLTQTVVRADLQHCEPVDVG